MVVTLWLRLVQSCVFVIDREQHSQSLRVSSNITAGQQWCYVTASRQNEGGPVNDKKQVTKTESARFWPCRITDARRIPAEKWRKMPMKGDIVVSLSSSRPDVDPCANQLVSDEQSEQGIESFPAPGLLLFNWPCSLMFPHKRQSKNVVISPWNQ